MANTTFNGPVRSENGFETISKNATTGAITITSGSKMATEALGGAGIEGTAETYITQVERFKSDTTTNVNLVKTTLMIDLTGLASSGANDIIGKAGSGVAYIGRVTTANTGVVFGVTMECFETPAGGDPDIDLYSATEATGVEDSAIGDLTETIIINGGDASVGTRTAGGTIVADQYLYLVSGDATNANYTAGRLVITILGYDVAS
jgi:hypothetical protein|tara:strand:- start:1451 stop:2068 length:618 start_codon:yes stop_codon:yes gene_type:complete